MAYTNIDSPKKYFEATTYTGNGSTQSITSLDFSPDFVWLKKRNDVGSHNLFDSIRGATKWLLSNTTNAEGTTATSLTSFDANGFSLGSNASTNSNTNTFISWSWRGSDSSAVSNTDGSITSTVSANTTSGFSIVSYIGTGAVGTIGHGLGQLPAMIIFKNRSSATDWMVFHKNSQSSYNFSATAFLTLNSNAAVNGTGVGGVMNDTAPTTSLFTVGNDSRSNGSGNSMIAYCFAEVKGYSKFGSFIGNGNDNGVFIYTGFKPAWFMYKKTNTTDNWYMLDNKRNTFNVANKWIDANTSDAEDTFTFFDFLSNGIKMRKDSANGSGDTYIYMCFAENPFTTSTGIPATAR
jgi:hypothetical protein